MSAVDDEVNYCIRCGEKLEKEDLFGKIRPVCPNCGWIYFADPKVAVAVLIIEGQNVLLVRRVNVPGQGLWTLPAGFVDAGEDPRSAACRECKEETGLEVEITDLIDVLYGQEHVRGAHILIAYRGVIQSGKMTPADDADQVAFFPMDALPELAFSTTNRIIGKAQSEQIFH
jgi:ADP-ribose pyrophosphatase YjhB (NUDIX family)